MKNQIRALRKQKGLTMKELGALVGLAESTISQYETGKRQPDNETLLRLGELFGVSVDYLLTGEENKKSPAGSGPDEVKMDDLEYALFGEVKELSDSDKQVLLSMAKQLNDARKGRM